MGNGCRFKETDILRECSVPIRLLAHRFVLDYAFGKIRLWSLEGPHRGIFIVFYQRSGLLFKETVRCESESYSGEDIEGLTAKDFGGDLILYGQTGCFLKIVNLLQAPRALLMSDFAPECSPQPRGADLRAVV